MIQTSPKAFHQCGSSATGCRGVSNYLSYAESLGFKFLEVLDWSSSAGDWQFLVSKDGHQWQILSQNNNWPRPGFTYFLDEEIFDGTFEEVLTLLANER